MGTVRHTLRRLRDFLGLEQRQLAVLVRRTRHTIEAIEQNRLRLSPKLAVEISKATGASSAWLLSNDELPMVNRSGGAYSRQDFEFARDEDLKPLQPYQVEPEMKVGIAYDLFYRALKAARKRNAVPQFIKRLEGYARAEVYKFPELQDEVLAGLRSGKAAGKDFLFPRSVEPLKRGRRRLAEAIAEFTAWEKTIKK